MAALIGSALQVGPDRVGDVEQQRLLETDRMWSEAAAAGEVEKIFNFWTDDAINYFPGEPPAIGKDAISKPVRKKRVLPGFSLSWKAVGATVAE